MRSFLQRHPVGRLCFARRYDVSVQGVMEVVVLHATVGWRGEVWHVWGHYIYIYIWKWKIVHKTDCEVVQ